MHNMDDSDEFEIADESIEQLLEIVEQAENAHRDPSSPIVLDDDFDDVDVDALVSMAEVAEGHYSAAANNSSDNSRDNNINKRDRSGRQRSIMDYVDRPARPDSVSSGSVAAASSASSSIDGSSSNNSNYQSPFLIPEDSVPPSPPPLGIPSFHPFDREALPTWIYPINYPVRAYQYNILQKAMFHNTLVALPTGLGKTFIAAVVMYNYWRWFPQSKIIFVAPTRPLVAQQIEACFKICGLPQEDTVELTGSLQPEKRKLLWASKRVYFMTPQTLQNDLRERICPADKIVCLVFDEAHKATGNYAYAEVIRQVVKLHDHFRVLALTATPGTNLDNVQAVITNLRINNVQIRTEDSMDIQEFSHGKSVQKMVVKLNYTAGATGIVPQTISTFREKIFQPVLQRLRQFQAIYSDEVERNTPYHILTARRNFMSTAKNLNQAVKGKIFVDFAIADALSRAYELLCQHGIGPFLGTMEQTLEKMQSEIDSGKSSAREKVNLVNNYTLKNLINELRDKSAEPGFIGHPKMDSLVNTLLQHFNSAQETQEPNQQSKVIVFSTYRNSVDEIVKVLSSHKPLIRCSSFVGQAGAKDGTKGLNQRKQKEVISKFRSGELNLLVATSIGEEGLDIGEVDLIICYDSQSSPIRMLQRMGRTGRKRQGRCVLLMTEQEEKKYQNAKDAYRRVQEAIARRTLLQYCDSNPTLLPENYKPVCAKKRLEIGTYTKPTTGRTRISAASIDDASGINADGTLNEETLQRFLQSFQDDGEVLDMEQVTNRYWPVQSPLRTSLKYIPLHSRLSLYKYVGHSRRSKQYAELVKKMEKQVLKGDISSQVSSLVDSSLCISSRQSQPNSMNLVQNDQIIIPRRRKRGEEDDNEDEANEAEKPDSRKYRKLEKDIPKAKSSDRLNLPKRSKYEAFDKNEAECSDTKRCKLDEDRSDELWLNAYPPVMKGMLDEEGDFDSFGQVSAFNAWDMEDNEKSIEKGKQPMTTSLSQKYDSWDESALLDVEKIFSEESSYQQQEDSTRHAKAETDKKNSFANGSGNADLGIEHMPLVKTVSADDKRDNLCLNQEEGKIDEHKEHNAKQSPEILRTTEVEVDIDLDWDFGPYDDQEKHHSENRRTITESNSLAFRFDDDLPPKYPYEGKEIHPKRIIGSSVLSFLSLSIPVLSEGAKRILEERQQNHKSISGSFLTCGIYARYVPANFVIAEKVTSSVTLQRSDSITFDSDTSFLEALADIPLSARSSQKSIPVVIDSQTSKKRCHTVNERITDEPPAALKTPLDPLETIAGVTSHLERHSPVNIGDSSLAIDKSEVLEGGDEDEGVIYFSLSSDDEGEQSANNMFASARRDKEQVSDKQMSGVHPSEDVIAFDFSGDQTLQRIMADTIDDERASLGISVCSNDDNSVVVPHTTTINLADGPDRLEDEDDSSILGNLAGSPELPCQQSPRISPSIPDDSRHGNETPSPLIRRVRKRTIIMDDSDDTQSQNSSNMDGGYPPTSGINEDAGLPEQLRPASLLDEAPSLSTPNVQEKAHDRPRYTRKHRKRSTTKRINVFLDLEAERSCDDCSTDDGSDEDENTDKSLCMDSFIHDGSSGLAPYESPVAGHSIPLQERQGAGHTDIYSVYRASLLSPDMLTSRGIKTLFDKSGGPKKKSWIDKLDTKKWERYAEDEDEDEDNEAETEAGDSNSIILRQERLKEDDSDFA
ncbi:hypothetical protein EC973_003411 [Apophysomyces ossiformis]|uniref:DNA helicase n=1 Tax=Apophysomyces ossiformis TaxID=679940 RepID=A0A8H7BTR9_9FUNG|nr:hypothetical protein EC973_003411 [Apophysomyces ossiformis]